MKTIIAKLSEEQLGEVFSNVEKWDQTKSILRACEEMSELQAALMHYHRGKCSEEHVKQEIADVVLAVTHLSFRFNLSQEILDNKFKKGLGT